MFAHSEFFINLFWLQRLIIYIFFNSGLVLQIPLVSSSAHVVLKEMFKSSNREIDTSAITGIVNLACVPGATVADVVVETLMKVISRGHSFTEFERKTSL